MCPNHECKELVFAAFDNAGNREVLPRPLIDFDPQQIPAAMLATLREAISCHAAGCYRAPAMMVRRLLEEICDGCGALGSNLHQRLGALKISITLPNELFDAIFELKALGNDAAHIEAKTYDSIGADEAADSIELAKEILKAMYQLKGLVSRLQARKKP